jgi:hypothetical protein
MKNPPAFPGFQEWTVSQDGDKISTIHRGWQSGMTLRDYFAAKALPELVRTALDLDHEIWDATARHAYLVADAMLKAREQ